METINLNSIDNDADHNDNNFASLDIDIDTLDATDVNYLIQQLGHADENERMSALMALTAIGKSAIGPLINAITYMRDEQTISCIGAALIGIGKPVVKPLLELLPKLSDLETIMDVVALLQQIGIDKDDEPAIEQLIDSIQPADDKQIKIIAAALASLGQPAKKALTRALASKNPRMRIMAVAALRLMEDGQRPSR